MNTLQLSQFLWKVTDWCMAHRGKNCLPLATRDSMFRYVALCFLTGRLAIANDERGEFETVAFYWVDWFERIECKDAEGKNQFDFNYNRKAKGDSLFVAEVIGNANGLSKIYQAAIAKFPNLITVPIYTYRSKKLVKLNPQTTNRLLFGKAWR